ncbi:hypothetical protein [Flavobacterium cerinum]|uniref:Uncharacterized protein n=1 Tax=Flavobacterium cerinum TaxID=2502784 RepID=A0A3S4T1F3_9FLAO|nr:hypothetical protein [Flavobacterium cerinum]RWX00377.1 hypothetical protein EPI11_08860 [Flavobacterium cerinum]
MENTEKKHSEDSQDDDKNKKSNFNTKSERDKDIEDTDKYLAMEQPGVKYTKEVDPTVNSDQVNSRTTDSSGEWNEEGGNSKNSEAFNQDDDILNDNIDLDEDQNQSISSDDDDFEESNERYTN